MKNVYLILAVLGAVIPYEFFLQFFADTGFDPLRLLAAAFANGAAAGFSADLFFSSFVFWLFMFKREAGPAPWLFIVLNLTIGLSCALPAYLYAGLAARDSN